MFVDNKTAGEVIVAPWQRVLIDAANYIEEHGWCQWRTHHGDKVCVGEALVRSLQSGECETWLYAYGKLRQHLGINNLDINNCSLAVWNDVTNRTKIEVIAALRACAAAG